MTTSLSRGLIASLLALAASTGLAHAAELGAIGANDAKGAFAVTAAPAPSTASTSPNVYFAGTVQRVEPYVLKTFGPTCQVQPAVLHTMAQYATGRWWLERQFPDCVHAQPGFRVTAELDTGRTVVIDQTTVAGEAELMPGERVWFESGEHRVRAMDDAAAPAPLDTP